MVYILYGVNNKLYTACYKRFWKLIYAGKPRFFLGVSL
jgi:hypothetical protein